MNDATLNNLSETAAAERLGISYRFLKELRRRGSGPAFARIGRRVVYAPNDIAAWLQSRQSGSKREKSGGGLLV